jgi:hypothetical protein
MRPETGDALAWQVRHYIYAHIAEHERPPTVDETAAHLDISHDEARTAYEWLNERHAILLEPGSLVVRMANPFSGVPTAYRVRAKGHSYWANCAWDALGIPAALHADAEIEAACPDSDMPVRIAVVDDEVRGDGEIVHFALPFRRWYEDLVGT